MTERQRSNSSTLREAADYFAEPLKGVDNGVSFMLVRDAFRAGASWALEEAAIVAEGVNNPLNLSDARWAAARIAEMIREVKQ